MRVLTAAGVCYDPRFLGARLIQFVELTPETIARGITWYVVLLLSLSVHESAHAWMALRFGDDTAQRLGRITLNPLEHMDPVGTVLMPLAQFLMMGAPLLAWAKPTPVERSNLRELRKGTLWVWGAGPLSNALLAMIFLALLALTVKGGLIQSSHSPFLYILVSGFVTNVGLGIFNLVPIPPLDGSWLASWGLPRELGHKYDEVMEPYGHFFLIGLLLLGGYVLGPVIEGITVFLFRLVF